MSTRCLGIGLAVSLTFLAPSHANAQAQAGAGERPAKPQVNADQVRRLLDEAVAAVDAIEAEVTDARKFGPPEYSGYPARLAPHKAEVLGVIAQAHESFGTTESARKCWASATEAILFATADARNWHADPDETASALTRLAQSRARSGDRAAALDLLSRAASEPPIVRVNVVMPAPPPPGVPMPLEPETLVRMHIAAAQAKIGDHAASHKLFASLIEQAERVEDVEGRVTRLSKIAALQPTEEARSTWERAARIASSSSSDILKAKMMDALIRARIGAGDVEATLQMLEALNGDARAYALCCAADELARSPKTIEPRVVADLLARARRTSFDHPLKRAQALLLTARVQARHADPEGAAQTLALVLSDSVDLGVVFDMGRVQVLSDIATAQLAKGAKDAGQKAAVDAMKVVASCRRAGIASTFPISAIARVQTKAGDVAGALESVALIEDSLGKVEPLVAIATTIAETGDRTAARKVLERARQAVAAAPRELLWEAAEFGGDRRHGPWQGAFRPTSEMKLSSAWQRIAIAHAECRDVNEALMITNDVKLVTAPMLNESNECLARIALAQARTGDFAGAAKSLAERQIMQNHDRPIIEGDAVVYPEEEVARLHVRAGGARDVLAWGSKLPNPVSRMDALRGFAKELGAIGDLSRPHK